jgi:hypothetical protein
MMNLVLTLDIQKNNKYGHIVNFRLTTLGSNPSKPSKKKVVNSVETTNNMQPCNRIYYSTVHDRLNMFRAVHRPSSGALTVFVASGLHTHVVNGRSQSEWKLACQFPLRLTTAGHHVRAPDDERCTARNMLSL